LEKSNLTFSLENHQKRKEKKKKRELPSQGRELIDKKTQRVFIYKYTHIRALLRIYKINILDGIIIVNQH
jgi:hypothetical protein